MIDRAKISYTEAQIYYLEMREKPQAETPYREDVLFVALPHPISVEDYRSHYKNVGWEYHWLDRLVMPDDELFEKINAPNAKQYLMIKDNQIAGFVEFIHEPNFTEILYFGLYPAFVGKGIGKYFLQWAVEKAWSFDAQWIQLNTCSLDHPLALEVYKSVGFEEVKLAVEQRRVYLI